MTQPAWTIRPAAPEDAAEIVAVIREGLSPPLLELCIYGCSGIAKYVAGQIGVQDRGGSAYYVAAVCAGRVEGCVEMRRLPGCLFVNYIAVRPELRGQGLGGRLLRTALGQGDSRQAGLCALDVFDFNTRALQWYQRLGFRQQQGTVWWQASLAAAEPASIVLTDYAQAQVSQREYGFSQFGLVAAGQRHEIGRLGENWYRLTSPAALKAPGVVAELRRLAPQRRLLLLSKTDYAPPPSLEARETARARRLAVPLETLRQRLRGATHDQCPVSE